MFRCTFRTLDDLVIADCEVLLKTGTSHCDLYLPALDIARLQLRPCAVTRQAVTVEGIGPQWSIQQFEQVLWTLEFRDEAGGVHLREAMMDVWGSDEEYWQVSGAPQSHDLPSTPIRHFGRGDDWVILGARGAAKLGIGWNSVTNSLFMMPEDVCEI